MAGEDRISGHCLAKTPASIEDPIGKVSDYLIRSPGCRVVDDLELPAVSLDVEPFLDPRPFILPILKIFSVRLYQRLPNIADQI